MSKLSFISLLFSSLALLSACGDDGGGGSADAGEEIDGGGDSPCGFEDRYLPYQTGYQWIYQVTDLGSGERSNKVQELTEETDAELGDVIVQTTQKNSGSTISKLTRVDSAVVRHVQEDRDRDNVLERTTSYDPGQVRLDEAEEKMMMGAMWQDMYEVVVRDETGTETSRGMRRDEWEVLGIDVPCESPLGSFRCLQVRRLRTAGGVSDKQFFFAKGIGKVREVNSNQLEELVACEKK